MRLITIEKLKVFLLLLLCFSLIAGCKSRKEPLAFQPQLQTEQEEIIIESELPAVDDTALTADTDTKQVNVSIPDQRPLQGVNLRAIGGIVNTQELDPVNYNNPDLDVLKLMGAQQYLISFLEGEQYYKNGNYSNAIAEYTASINNNAEFVQGFISRGNTFLKMGEYERAINDFTRAIRLDSGRAEVYNYRGYTRMELSSVSSKKDAKNNLLNAAIEDFTQAIVLNSGYTDAYINRSYALFEAGEYDKVIEDCGRILHLEPQNASVWNRRGKAWYAKGEDDKAFADFEKARLVISD